MARYRLKLFNEKGESLTMVVISIGIMSVIALGAAQMMASQARETRALAEKLAALNLKNLLTTALADGTVCRFEVNNPLQTFNSASPVSVASATMNVNQIRSRALATAPNVIQKNQYVDSTNLLYIKSIELKNFSGSGANYVANWVVSFDSTKLVRPLSPIQIPTTLTVDNSTPGATRITACMGMNFAGGTCPAGQQMSGLNSDGSPQCINTVPGNSCPSGQIVTGMNSNGTAVCTTPAATTVNGGTCPSGQIVTGMNSNGSPQCTTPATTTVSGGSCPAGQIVTGINSNGSPQCTTITVGGSCPAGQTMTGLNGDFTPRCTTTIAVGGSVIGSPCSVYSPRSNVTQNGMVMSNPFGQRCCAVSDGWYPTPGISQTSCIVF